MDTIENKKYGKIVNVVYPGEYFITARDELITTILGSCVSVCLYDRESGLSGLNHFMLPGKSSLNKSSFERAEKYGIAAIHKLLYEFEKRGVDLSSVIAKIFGGASILAANCKGREISSDNIRLAKIILEHEDIPIESMDVGGNYTRKIILQVKTGHVFLRKIKNGTIVHQLIKNEKKYEEKLLKKIDNK